MQRGRRRNTSAPFALRFWAFVTGGLTPIHAFDAKRTSKRDANVRPASRGDSRKRKFLRGVAGASLRLCRPRFRARLGASFGRSKSPATKAGRILACAFVSLRAAPYDQVRHNIVDFRAQ